MNKMDITPKTEDSGNVSSSFDASSWLFESTPKCHTEIVPPSNPKKRKVQYCDIRGRKLENLLETCPSTPQASSTLNESLTREFENIKIEQNCFSVDYCDEPPLKHQKTSGCDKLVTPPSTPESHLRSFETTPRKVSSFQKCSSTCSIPTPLKEQHEILYPTLKPLEPSKKPLTPQKFKEKIGQNSTPLLRFQILAGNRSLLNVVLDNDVIMAQIFGYLSNGDLFRVSMVSRGFRNALWRNFKASQRYITYIDGHKKNKENYKITPPSSPESQNLFPEGSVSPNSQHFAGFVKTGSHLNPNQSLIKCPKCGNPSIVEKSIAQCTETLSCGYIFCQKCECFAYNPEEFYDKCRDLSLHSSPVKARQKLEDLTNNSLDFNISSILSSTMEHYYSSGYGSGYETTRTPHSVKRDLSTSFGANDSLIKPQKVLFDSNRYLNSSAVSGTKREERRKSSGQIVRVVKSETVRRKTEIIEPSSPPKIKSYAACSKESRRNLKRLTR